MNGQRTPPDTHYSAQQQQLEEEEEGHMLRSIRNFLGVATPGGGESATAAAAAAAPAQEGDRDLPNPEDLIQEGDHVLLQMSDGRMIFADAGAKSVVIVQKKSKLKTRSLLGQPYGSVFEILPGRGSDELVRIEGGDLVPDDTLELAGDVGESGEVTGGNSSFGENQAAQSFTSENLEQMREEGASGKEIIERLAEGSSTFALKTEFSRRKWLSKMALRHRRRFRVCRITSRAVCDIYATKDPIRTCNLRSDRLALILSRANVAAGKQVLLFETVMGVLSYAVLERMSCIGRILAIYSRPQLDIAALAHLNVTRKTLKDTIVRISTTDIPKPGDGDIDDDDDVAAEDLEPQADNEVDQGPLRSLKELRSEMEERGWSEEIVNEHMLKAREKAIKAKAKTVKEYRIQGRKLLRMGSDCLIVATRYHPLEPFRRLYPFLALSCPFVVYCEYVEPLVECFSWVKQSGQAVQVELFESWQREYQVLPHRTHPTMWMDSRGGYILSGIKVEPRGDIPSAIKPSKRRRKPAPEEGAGADADSESEVSRKREARERASAGQEESASQVEVVEAVHKM